MNTLTPDQSYLIITPKKKESYIIIRQSRGNRVKLAANNYWNLILIIMIMNRYGRRACHPNRTPHSRFDKTGFALPNQTFTCNKVIMIINTNLHS